MYKISIKNDAKLIAKCLIKVRSSGVAKGGGRPGCHHFGVTPFGVTPLYDVKP